MERIDLRKETLLKAYLTLAEAISILQEAQQSGSSCTKSHVLAFQDSVIKRFEFCSELTWKYLKDLLEKRHGVIASSPKKVFVACKDLGVLSDEQLLVVLSIVDARNSTAHEYNELIAKNICQQICTAYYPVMKVIIHKSFNEN